MTDQTGEPRRLDQYRKDPDKEAQLAQMNERLAPLQSQLVAQFHQPQQPLVWIIGAPRSGTTLLSQLLARSDGYSYITNFVARFWKAPYLGAMIQQSIGLETDPSDLGLDSQLGVTSSWSGPHEFGYFWRRWFPFGETHKLTEEQLRKIDSKRLASELAAVESVTHKPLFMKNLTCGLQALWLAEAFPRSLFVLVRRDPVYNAQSLLRARQELYGDTTTWLSLRPPEYRSLVPLTPVQQVVGQVYFTLRDIQRSLGQLHENNWIEIGYEDLCRQPQELVKSIGEAVEDLGGAAVTNPHHLPARLEDYNQQKVDDQQWQRIEEAVDQFFVQGEYDR